MRIIVTDRQTHRTTTQEFGDVQAPPIDAAGLNQVALDLLRRTGGGGQLLIPRDLEWTATAETEGQQVQEGTLSVSRPEGSASFEGVRLAADAALKLGGRVDPVPVPPTPPSFSVAEAALAAVQLVAAHLGAELQLEAVGDDHRLAFMTAGKTTRTAPFRLAGGPVRMILTQK